MRSELKFRSVIVVHHESRELGRWSLFDFTGRDQSHGSEASDGVLRLMGFDLQTARCWTVPSTWKAAQSVALRRVEKVIRPTTALGVDRLRSSASRSANTPCISPWTALTQHPLHPQPDMSLAEYESAYQASLERATLATDSPTDATRRRARTIADWPWRWLTDSRTWPNPGYSQGG